MVKKNDPSSSKQIINRGAWTIKEDKKLADYINTHGERKWRSIPARAGLNRCGKSCRLRWLNYLRPGIKRGNISEDEEDLIIRLHNLLGNRWSLIAGRIPGRTDNEIKNHWNTHLSKKSLSINDLNLKLNQKLETTQVPLPVPNPAGAQVFPTQPLNAGEISRSCNEFQPLNCVEILRPWSELLEKDFDVNEFFDFPDSELPGTDPLSSNQDKVQEERSKLKEFHVDGMYENLLNTELQGSSIDWGEHSTEHDKCDEFDIDVLARLLDYDEDDMLNSFCTYGR